MNLRSGWIRATALSAALAAGQSHTASQSHREGYRRAAGLVAGPVVVVDFYDKGGIPNRNLHEKIKKLNLTAVQKKDLVEFLKALNGQPIRAAIPTVFPQ
ncbi:MAG: hypothetical protein ABI811_05700 [Acidobacteriota bacterium]